MTIHIERLKLLSTMLREVAAGTWKPTELPENNYTSMVLRESGTRFNLENWITCEQEGNFCGFSACAVGHACLDERFGLSLSFDEEGVTAHPAFMIGDRCTTGWAAVRAYFGLEQDEDDYLFSEYSYTERDLSATDPGVVADRIDDFITNGGTPCSQD